MTDADKLRNLAKWFDRYDDEREFPGTREVQADLRRIADNLDKPIPSLGLRFAKRKTRVAHPGGTYEKERFVLQQLFIVNGFDEWRDVMTVEDPNGTIVC